MRVARWLFIIVQFAWLNIVLPGHTRGAITIGPSRSGGHSCCVGHSSPDNPTGKSGHPTPADRQHCAICYFAAGLATPPPVISVPGVSWLVEVMPAPAPASIDGVGFPLTCHGRAPPVC